MRSIKIAAETSSWNPVLSRPPIWSIDPIFAILLVNGILISALGQTTFTRITTGPIVTDGGISWACAWGDYDNDGYLDLFVSNGDYGAGAKNFLYHNNHDGTFTRVVTGSIVNDVARFRGATWADFDNDGYLDLSVACYDSPNVLYRNNRDGTFTRTTNGVVVNDLARESIAASWADYNRDGYLDFFIANAANVPNFLYFGGSSGTYQKITLGSIATDLAYGEGGAWADYDNDGFPDLFATNFRNTRNFLYHNTGKGTFDRITSPAFGTIVSDAGNAHGCAWGDYDNDGYLDLFVSNGDGFRSFLYHNDGGHGFTFVTNVITATLGDSVGCAWGDYDNDGYLDLFVANLYQNNFLYHNNGDGTFTRVTTGSIVNDGGRAIPSIGCSWGDYDNDGFLDLVVANGGGPSPAPVNNFLYHNDGNTNAWIKIKCIGLVSNRSAIGAKVRVKASIRGKTFWQLREVTVGDGFSRRRKFFSVKCFSILK